MGEKAPCAFCGVECDHLPVWGTPKGNVFVLPLYDCPGCGQYVLGRDLFANWVGQNNAEAFKIACLVREKQLAIDRVIYGVFEDDYQPDEYHVESQLKAWWRIGDLLAEFPKPTELIGRSLSNLRRLVKHPMETITCPWDDLAYLMFCPRTSLTNQFNSMTRKSFLRNVGSKRRQAAFIITPDGWDRIEKKEKKPMVIIGTPKKEVFVVHGHDGELRSEVCRLMERLGLKPIVLFEQPDKGRTIIEKFEQHSDVGYAVVLLTPDDEGRSKGEESLRPRARQNVILELGFFIARLGRERVCPLVKKGIEHPSDIHGVIYTEADEGGAWRYKLAKELKAAGFNIDLNKVE